MEYGAVMLTPEQLAEIEHETVEEYKRLSDVEREMILKNYIRATRQLYAKQAERMRRLNECIKLSPKSPIMVTREFDAQLLRDMT